LPIYVATKVGEVAKSLPLDLMIYLPSTGSLSAFLARGILWKEIYDSLLFWLSLKRLISLISRPGNYLELEDTIDFFPLSTNFLDCFMLLLFTLSLRVLVVASGMIWA